MAASLLRPPRIGKVAVVVGGDARLKREDVVDPVDRELFGNGPSMRCLVVTSSRGTSGWVWLTTVISWISTAVCSSWMSTVPVWPGQHLHPVDLGGLVADERGPDGNGARRDVVDEVVALGVREGVERRPHDEHLGVGDGGAGLIAHPAFDLTGRALGQERARSQGQPDCREREYSRSACEGADTALLHGYVLQRREPAGTAIWSGEGTLLPSRLIGLRWDVTAVGVLPAY